MNFDKKVEETISQSEKK